MTATSSGGGRTLLNNAPLMLFLLDCRKGVVLSYHAASVSGLTGTNAASAA